MNWLDIVLIIPILWGFYRGFKKGLVVEAGTLVALIGGIYCAMNFSNYAAGYLKKHFGWTSDYLHFASLLVTFVLVVILVIVIARLITAGMDAGALTPINKVLGALFGALKFAFIFSILIFFLSVVEKNVSVIPEATKKSSYLFHPVASIAPMFIHF